MKKMIVCLVAAVSLVWAAAISSNVTIYQPSQLNGVVLKPGDYKLEVEGEKLTLRNGKTVAEATVKAQESETKHAKTSLRFTGADGKMSIAEIRIGGTKTSLIVN